MAVTQAGLQEFRQAKGKRGFSTEKINVLKCDRTRGLSTMSSIKLHPDAYWNTELDTVLKM